MKFYASVCPSAAETLKKALRRTAPRAREGREEQAFKRAEFDIIYGSGLVVPSTGIERKAVTKSGSYFSFGDERLGQGRQNAAAFLREHPT